MNAAFKGAPFPSRLVLVLFTGIMALAILPADLSAQPGEGERPHIDRRIDRDEAGKTRRMAETALAAESPLKLTDKPAAVALEDLTLFETEPKQRFWLFTTNPHGEIGTISKNEMVRILETKYVDTLTERSVWLRVARESQGRDSSPVDGWVYAGKSQGDQVIIPVAEERR